MNTYRKTAIMVGVLFIIGTVAGILSVALSGPARDEARYLVDVSSNANQITVAALCVLLMGLALALVPIVLFPLLKKYNEVLALGYVVFRGALETVHLYRHDHQLASAHRLKPGICESRQRRMRPIFKPWALSSWPALMRRIRF